MTTSLRGRKSRHDEIAAAIRSTTAAFPLKGLEDRTGSSPLSLYATAATVCRYLARGSRILDFGSGACHKSAVLQSLGYCVSATDDLGDARPGEADLIVSFACQQGVDFTRATRGGHLPTLSHYAQSSFDMVMLHHVLEHWPHSPRVLCESLLSLCKPGGLLFVTVPNAGNIRKRIALLAGKTNLPPYHDFYWSEVPWRGHVREYVRGDLVLLSKYLNLEVLELNGIDDLIAVQRRHPAVVLPYRLASNVFRGWKDTWKLVARKKREASSLDSTPSA